RLSDLAASIDRRMLRIASAIHFDDIRAQQIYIPHDQCPASEVVRTLLGYGTFCCRAVVVLAPYFHRKNRRAFEKIHACPGTNMISCAWTKGFPMRQVYVESGAISIRSSLPSLFGVMQQSRSNFQTRKARVIACW